MRPIETAATRHPLHSRRSRADVAEARDDVPEEHRMTGITLRVGQLAAN
jgi:hypothetical protein